MKNISNPLKNTLIKIDRWFLDTLTQYVRKWIKKHDYTKHKIDFTIQVQKVKIALVFGLAMLVPAITYLLEGRYFQAGFHGAIWSISVGIYIIQMQKTVTDTKQRHDILFSMRKNPAVYDMEKAVLELVFVMMRKRRIIFTFFDFFVSWLFVFMLVALYMLAPTQPPSLTLALYFFVAPFIHVLEQYLLCVFDFDEPEEKKKVAKESISEIFLRSWQNLIGGLAPQPNYG